MSKISNFFIANVTKALKLLKLRILRNFDNFLSQTFTKFFPVLPSILSKYQLDFDQLWANITSILTNFDQRLNYWGGCYTPHTHPIATSLVFRILHTTIPRLLIYLFMQIRRYLNNTNVQLLIKRNHFLPQIHTIKCLLKYLVSAYIAKIGIYFPCKMNKAIVEEKTCILNSILTTFFLSCQSADVFKIVFSPR